MKFEYLTGINTDHKSFSTEFLLGMLNQFQKTIDDQQYGFFHLTDESKYLEQTKSILEKIKNKKHFIQVGIGGSALGPQMLVSSLAPRSEKKFSLLDNTDSDYIQMVLDNVELKDAIFYVVSKSGGTAETIACYSIVRNLLLQNGVTKDELGQYFVFCTDPTQGQLRKHVSENEYLALEVPSNIGGRFSVLTPVGLLPAAFMGINIDELYIGANHFKEELLSKKVEENPLLQTAAHMAYLFIENPYEEKEKVNETVLMPYSSKLKDFSFWFVQLWAESLGKFSKEKNGPMGLTPIPAYGATDQHSQVQLFMEGPNNKCLFLIHIKNKENNFDLTSDLELDSAAKLSGHNMNQLIEAEYQGTVKALQERGRYVITLEIDKLNASNLGALVLFFESLTVLFSKYIFVDPFNQPGVELGKKYAFEYLNSQLK